MQQNPLASPVAGVLLRCGGIVGKGLRKRICGTYVVMPYPLPATNQEMYDHLAPLGWGLGLVSIGRAGTHMTGDKLRTNGEAAFDPLCPTCNKALRAALARGAEHD
jgi:hypothetical protein